MPAAVRKVIGNRKQFFFSTQTPLRLERLQKQYIVQVTPKDFRYLSWLGTLHRGKLLKLHHLLTFATKENLLTLIYSSQLISKDTITFLISKIQEIKISTPFDLYFFYFFSFLFPLSLLLQTFPLSFSLIVAHLSCLFSLSSSFPSSSYLFQV